jgi:Fe-S-cluster containining protein
MQLAANPSASPKEVRMAADSRFSCNSCTRCCTGKHLLGPVSADEVQKILAGFKEAGLPGAARASDFIPLGNDGQPPESFLLRTENGRCSFLQESGLCGIHAQLGEELKPAACRLFPFRPVRTVSGWDVGLSLSCPTVANGSGDDANSEALKTVTSLAKSSSLLQVLTDTVQLDSVCKVPYELYGDWEEKSVTRLLDESEDAAISWISVVEDFEALLQKQTGYQSDSWLELASDDTSTMEMSNISASEPVISERGQGDLNPDVGHAADILLRDLAVWLELLVGLEAADPGALRRVRRGLVRLRSALNVSPRSASVLAERARISQLVADAADTLGDNFKSEDSDQLTATRPAIRPVHTKKVRADVLTRRFLVQALVGKSLFRYSTVRHGLLAVTIHLALMSLEDIENDPYFPKIEDISYLFQHPQFSDVIDSRAIVHHHQGDGSIHRSILGVGYRMS